MKERVMLNQKKEKVEPQIGRGMSNAEKKTTTCRLGLIRERKMALQKDVDKLKKRLRHEENVHRALERAFTRPLGVLPRLPPYLPPDVSLMLELLAEVAVLEEEIVRLEEKVVHFRQGLYQEAIYISSSKKNIDISASLSYLGSTGDLKPKQFKLFGHMGANSSAVMVKNSPSTSDENQGNENYSGTNSLKTKQKLPNSKLRTVKTPARKLSVESRSVDRRLDPKKLQLENCVKEDHEGSKMIPSVTDSPNMISENILKCLMNIFLRMCGKRSRSTTETLPLLSTPNFSEKLAETKDPYRICSRFGKRDIGPYVHLYEVKATSINPNQTTVSIFLVQRLKLLFEKLASVELKGLTHQEKLAFWINIYNSCMMNAFIEYGIPESPEVVVALMQKATVNVGGHILSAITIEHFILRLPYHLNSAFTKGAKYDEMTTRNMFGLELSEPLVTFALSCGSWSSPAVRVYTASQVENQLETAKREYIQAAIGISTTRKLLALPKLLDWYLLDFAKDIESLLDWVCLQLPHELGKEAMKCIERKKDEPLGRYFQIMPSDWDRTSACQVPDLGGWPVLTNTRSSIFCNTSINKIFESMYHDSESDLDMFLVFYSNQCLRLKYVDSPSRVKLVFYSNQCLRLKYVDSPSRVKKQWWRQMNVVSSIDCE
ncbi:hypothetical protein STAS_12678 [Striga asiatica]|uniref:Ternary complex factor MIP1, leucine-zipper n=1 Tax=Striga asiatica TaxID=4170 RepID=A0A5A7PUM9_STRAF|nr:hypothetical protein STAS_12678 [Striga asiatica]